jgi:hypothetical protein
MNLFDDIRGTREKLKPHQTNGTSQGIAGKFARAVRGVDGAPVGDSFLIMSRTLPPTMDYVYGANKEPRGTVPGPYYVGAPLIENYGPHRPVWEGWRPKRPVKSYPEVGKVMMEPERNYKIESSIPDQSEIINLAMRNTLAPYPTVPQSDPIPDPYRFNFMEVEKAPSEMSGYLGYLGFLGQTETTAKPQTTTIQPAGDVLGFDVGGVAKSVADTIRTAYQADVERYKAQQQGTYVPSAVTRPAPDLPWGTIAIAGGAALLALFVLPKVLK